MKHIRRIITCITTLVIIPCSPVRRQKDKNIEIFIDKLLHSDKFEKLADDIAERAADKLAHLQRTTTDEPTTTITDGEWTGKQFKSRKFEKVLEDDSSEIFDFEVPSKRSEDLNIDIDKVAVVKKFRSQRDPDLTLRYKHFTKAEDLKHSTEKKRRKTKTHDDNLRMRVESDEEVTTKKSHRKHKAKKSSHVPDDSEIDHGKSVANASSSRGSDSDELSLPIKLTELDVQESKEMLKTTHKHKNNKKVHKHHKSDDKKKERKEVEEEKDVSIDKEVDNKKSAEERKTKIRVVDNQKNQSVENDKELSQKDKERNKKGNSTTEAVDLTFDKSEEESKHEDRSIKTIITKQVTKNVKLLEKSHEDKNDNNSTMVTDNTTRTNNLTFVIDKAKNTNTTISVKKATSNTRINNDTKVDATTKDTTADDSDDEIDTTKSVKKATSDTRINIDTTVDTTTKDTTADDDDEIDTTKRSPMTTVTETERTEEIDLRNVVREENGKLFAFNNGSDYEEYHDNIAKQVKYAKSAQKSRKDSRKVAKFSLPDFF